MQKKKIIKTSVRLILSGFIILASFLFNAVVKAEEPEGAFNNVLVKDFSVKYHESTGTIDGEAIIGNFSDQSFYNLNYKLELLAYGKDIDLGIVVHEEIASNSFSIQGQGEVRESFSYKIPEGVPSGDYNFVFQIVDSRGRPLGFDSYSFTYSNNANNLITVNPESIKIEINKEDHNWGEGPSTKKGDEVKLKFELTNNNQESIVDVTPHLTIYPYTPSLKQIKEEDLESFSLNAEETKQFSYQMPELTNPQSYLAVVEFKKDNQLVALPVRGRWVVEGIQGKIFTSGIDKNNNLTLEVIGSPFSEEESGIAMVSILDGNGKTCFFQEKEIAEVGAGTQIVSLPINFQEQCLNPTIKAELNIKGKVVDTYEKKLDSNSVEQLQVAIMEEDEGISKRTIALFLLIIPAIAVLITLVAVRDKEKRKKLIGLLLLILAGGTLFVYSPIEKIKAWNEKVGKYNHWHANYGYFPGSWNKSQINKQQDCIDSKNSYCYKVPKLWIHGNRGHDAKFSRVSWSLPAHNSIFKSDDKIWIKAGMIHSWCNNGYPHSSKVYATIYSRDTRQKVKTSHVTVPKYARLAKFNIGTFNPGKYTIYLETTGWAGFLYHGMIRHFEVVGDCDCSSSACYKSKEELLANDSFCTGEGTTHTDPVYHTTGSTDISPWTWTWDCNLGSYIKKNCRAYKEPECGDAILVSSPQIPTNNLCSVGKPSEVTDNNDTWNWTCGNGECTPVNCLATQQPPSCNIVPDSSGVCPGQTTKIKVTSLIPPDGIKSWEFTNNNGLLVGDFYEMGVGTAKLTVTNLSGQSDYCIATVGPKSPWCKVSLEGSENLTVGERIEIKVTEECMEKATSHPYFLRVIYQGEEDLTEESYKYIQEINNNGEAIIEIKKAGSFIFSVDVNKDGGGSVTCSSQASAFTSGSEWWERKPE